LISDDVAPLAVVSLKVCEVCGVLWCRPEKSTAAYCACCESKLAKFPEPLPKARTGRPTLASIKADRALDNLAQRLFNARYSY
jgi:hypothetical protein